MMEHATKDGRETGANPNPPFREKSKRFWSKMVRGRSADPGSRTHGCGVHAKEQVANVHLKEQVDPQEVKQYLNRYLPEDIAVSEVTEVPERFHSRLNATGRFMFTGSPPEKSKGI